MKTRGGVNIFRLPSQIVRIYIITFRKPHRCTTADDDTGQRNVSVVSVSRSIAIVRYYWCYWYL